MIELAREKAQAGRYLLAGKAGDRDLADVLSQFPHPANYSGRPRI